MKINICAKCLLSWMWVRYILNFHSRGLWEINLFTHGYEFFVILKGDQKSNCSVGLQLHTANLEKIPGSMPVCLQNNCSWMYISLQNIYFTWFSYQLLGPIIKSQNPFLNLLGKVCSSGPKEKINKIFFILFFAEWVCQH